MFQLKIKKYTENIKKIRSRAKNGFSKFNDCITPDHRRLELDKPYLKSFKPALETTNPKFLDFSLKTNSPLIGCEYLIELREKKEKCSYICTLCNKRGNPTVIMGHLTSHNHRSSYLASHFPKLMTFLNKNRKFNNNMNYKEKILTFLSKAIEDKFRILKPTVCVSKHFKKNKNQIVASVKSLKHIAQEDFPDYLKILKNAIDTDELDVISNDKDPLLAYQTLTSYKKMIHQQHWNISSPTPDELHDQSIKLEQFSCFFEKYKILTEKAVDEIEQKYSSYETSPICHPMYSGEWRASWHRRYRESFSQGRDAANHDYVPEWIVFWKARVKELKSNEVEEKFTEICEKLNFSKVVDEIFEMQSQMFEYPRNDRSRRFRSPINDTDDEILWMSKDHKKKLKRSSSLSGKKYSEIPQSSSYDFKRHDSCPTLVSPSTSTSECALSQPDDEELAKQEISQVVAQNLLERGITDVSAEEISEIVNEILQSQMGLEETNEMPVNVATMEPPILLQPNEDFTNDELGGLSDDDLNLLLKNFSQLTEDDQKKLMTFIEKNAINVARMRS